MHAAGRQHARKNRSWSAHTSDAVPAARAGGRARYNATRRLQAAPGRRELMARWRDLATFSARLWRSVRVGRRSSRERAAESVYAVSAVSGVVLLVVAVVTAL